MKKLNKLFLSLTFIFIMYGCEDTKTAEEYLPPIENKGISSINIMSDTPKINKPVTFKAKDGIVFDWNILDSEGNSIYTSNEKEFSYIFKKSGEYTVILKANNSDESRGVINIPDDNADIRYSISLGNKHSIISDLTSDNLYVWGSNENGKLCVDEDNYTKLDMPSLLSSYRDLDSTNNKSQKDSVAAGDNHTLFVSNNRVWGCGDNTYGQLGLGQGIKGGSEPTAIKTIRIGKYVNYYLGAKGNISSAVTIFNDSGTKTSVYIWGGEKSNEEPTYLPRTLVSVGARNEPIQAIGRNFYLYRATMAFNMFSGGWNDKGQMGRVSYRYESGYNMDWNPDLPENIAREDSWNYSSYTAYIFAPYGEEYDKEYEDVAGGLTDISYFSNPSSEARLAAGDYFSMAVKRNSSSVDDWDVLYVWGDNSEGQLGLNGKNTPNIIRRPAPLFNNNPENDKRYRDSMSSYAEYNPIRATIKEIAAGRAHGLAVDDKGVLYAWGANGKNQLTNIGKTNATNNRVVEIPVPNGATKWLNVWAGGNRTIALADDYNLYTWGDNEDGILGIGSDEITISAPIKLTFDIRPVEESIEQ